MVSGRRKRTAQLVALVRYNLPEQITLLTVL